MVGGDGGVPAVVVLDVEVEPADARRGDVAEGGIREQDEDSQPGEERRQDWAGPALAFEAAGVNHQRQDFDNGETGSEAEEQAVARLPRHERELPAHEPDEQRPGDADKPRLRVAHLLLEPFGTVELGEHERRLRLLALLLLGHSVARSAAAYK